MEAVVIIERGTDGTYGAYIGSDNVPFGAIGEGKTVADAIDDFKSAVNDMRECYDEMGKEFPDIKFTFKYDTASFLQYYAYAFTLAGLGRITGVNQRQLSHYINGVRTPSRATVEKIEARLHEFAKEISAVKFV